MSSEAKKNSPSNRPQSRLQIRLPSNRPSSSGGTNNTPRTPKDDASTKQKSAKETRQLPKYKPRSMNPDVSFSTTDEVFIHHQRSSLHFIYNHINKTWNYSGETTMYLSHVPDVSEQEKANHANKNIPSTHVREIAFHMRGGDKMKITNATVYIPLPEANKTESSGSNIALTAMRADVVHHDPLSKVLTKPAGTFTSEEFSTVNEMSTKKRRYEADTQCVRGGQGMMDAMRCASVASNFGEGRARFVCPSSKVASDKVLFELWRNDLENGYKDMEQDSETDDHIDLVDGSLQKEIFQQDYERGGDRRKKRLDLIAGQMIKDTLVNKNTASAVKKTNPSDESKNASSQAPPSKSNSSALHSAVGVKLVIQFEMQGLESNVHLGGIHFNAPTDSEIATTPHVYTSTGIIGDHEGTRSWIPTIDSASSKHRSSHELSVRVTSDCKEGLWAAGCGEHFGVSKTVLHIPPKQKNDLIDSTNAANENLVPSAQDEKLEKETLRVLGQKCVDYISKTFGTTPTTTNQDGNDIIAEERVHIIPPDHEVLNSSSLSTSRSLLSTSTWSTSIWSPCPSRSLGFAIGPFSILYDPEYYGKDDDDDDENEEEDDDEEGEEDDEEYATITETAEKCGEGIRQLYFALKSDRPFIHSNSQIIGADEIIDRNSIINGSVDIDLRRKLIVSITGSTAGVPNRSLSLMRDILSLPSYRTLAYTQIWIPNAVGGGVSSGALNECPEISCNCFLGGAILDSKLLHPIGFRMPFFKGGRALQFAQARCAVRGWVTAALSLGGIDDVSNSYLHKVIENFIMSLYERAHGSCGQGGSKHGFFFSKRYALISGLNSKNMDFLPVNNVEEEEMYVPIMANAVGSLPVDEKGNEQLWRNANNGTESHTATLDEFSVRQLLSKDALEGIERVDKSLPSMGWLGSCLSTTYFASNSTSSSRVGCGAVELVHPVGGSVYRELKCNSLSKIIEGRAGVSNFIRVIRAAFIAGLLEDKGIAKVDLPQEKSKKNREKNDDKKRERKDGESSEKPKPLFVLCVEELLKKGGLTHGSFIKCLREIAGPIREPYLRGDLVDVSRKTKGQIPSQPEGFPNSFVKGNNGFYLRVGVHVESASTGNDQQVRNTSLQAHVLAEPVIPDGGVALGGPITVKIIEKGGQCREFVRVVETDGSRSDWGPVTLYGQSVTTIKEQQLAASASVAVRGNIDKKDRAARKSKTLFASSTNTNYPAFTENLLHRGGFQALELIRLTNLTPLLWTRVDAHGLFDGRIALFQQDACLGEQLFHDGEAASQIEALRSLAERPLRLQGSVKVQSLYDVPVEDLPIHLLGDCLRGSVALHADLPHNPCIRAQAALAIAQWQNNKAPGTPNHSIGWIGLHLLVQYLNERFYKGGCITSAKFSRVCLKTRSDSGTGDDNAENQVSTDSGEYQYLDMYDSPEDRVNVIETAKVVEREEDEEYRVRSAVITALSSIRAKDGLTPSLVLEVMEKILQIDNEKGPTGTETLEEELSISHKRHRANSSHNVEIAHHSIGLDQWFQDLDSTPYLSSSLVSDALLSLCYINIQPEIIEDPATGRQMQSKAEHPCLPLMRLCKRWLDWDLYKEKIELESEGRHMSPCGRTISISPSAITALYSLALLRQSTTDANTEKVAMDTEESQKRKRDETSHLISMVSDSQFYVDIFDETPFKNDATRGAAAQAVLSICCASDRIETPEPVGLLTSLEFALKRILGKPQKLLNVVALSCH